MIETLRDKHKFDDGGQIFLRRLTPADVTDRYLAWFRDESVIEYLDARNLTQELVVRYIVDGAENRVHFMYGIIDKSSGKHIGNLKVGPINWKHRFSDLICVIGDRQFWGQGIACEAIKIGIRIAWEEYDMRKLTAGIDSSNIGSVKAYTRAGFEVEAILKGQHLHNGSVNDRLLVSCFNPKYFSAEDRI